MCVCARAFQRALGFPDAWATTLQHLIYLCLLRVVVCLRVSAAGVSLDDDAREWWVGEKAGGGRAAGRGGGRFPPFSRMRGDDAVVDEAVVADLVQQVR